MVNFICDNLSELAVRHYVRKATAHHYWHDLRAKRLDAYRSLYGEGFCFVVYGSEEQDDAYVIPFSRIISLLDPAFLDARGRWIGSIANDLLSIRRSHQTVSVSSFYNAFDFLDSEILKREEESLLANDMYASPNAIRLKLALLNHVYREATPQKRRTVSEIVTRPGAISDYVKQLRGYTCQICGQEGFWKRSGVQFAETHHIAELHRLIPGSYCSDNIVVVCATCHRKLHYANVSYSLGEGNLVYVTINGERYAFERNAISDAIEENI